LVQTAPNNPLGYQSVDSAYIARECTDADANDDPVIAEVRLIHSTAEQQLTHTRPKPRPGAESMRNLVRRISSCVQNCFFTQKPAIKLQNYIFCIGNTVYNAVAFIFLIEHNETDAEIFGYGRCNRIA
jgi:hypothetical protein